MANVFTCITRRGSSFDAHEWGIIATFLPFSSVCFRLPIMKSNELKVAKPIQSETFGPLATSKTYLVLMSIFQAGLPIALIEESLYLQHHCHKPE